jgi:hypothetical protein
MSKLPHIAAALVLMTGAAFAQPAAVAPIPPRWTMDLPRRSEAPASDPRVRAAQDQAWAMVGREDRISVEERPACAVSDVDPLEAIASAAAATQIVIVNEAHDSPRDRAFIADVAVKLADVGYSTYAAETFFSSAANRNGAETLRLADGWYSQEPMFGALVRAVQREGYRIVAYDAPQAPATEDFIEDINRREATAASNLVNRIFLGDRDAKVIVHVGYRHNDESVQRFPRGTFQRQREITWLAKRMKDILGIDPLTIDQTVFGADKPGLCVAGADGVALPAGRDLYMAHPPLSFDRNRPTWRSDTGAREVETPRRLRRASERVILEARRAEDPVDAVPVDRVLIDPGEDIPLLLPPGKYKARAVLESGALLPETPITVRPAPRQPSVSRVSAEGAK